MRKLLALGAALTVVLIVVAGCGSSGSSSSSSSTTAEKTSTEGSGAGGSSASAAAAVKQAEANIAELTQEPPKLEVPPMKKPAPTGKDLTFAGCPLPVCVAVEEGVDEAAKVLDWNVKPVNQGLSPATVQTAWNGIAEDPGDGIISTLILPDEQISKQLEQIEGTPYVTTAPGAPTDKWMKGEVTGPNVMEGDGKSLASWVVQNGEGEPGETIYVWDPALAPLVQAHAAFHATMEELCPECEVTDLKVATADAGTKIPEEVVNTLRTHEAAYVVFNLGDYTAGVPQAIKAANLPSPPTLLTRAASTTNMEQIKNGEMATALTVESTEAGWRAVDLIARLINGEELYEGGMAEGGRTFLTQENLPSDISVPFTVPSFEESFEKTWGK